MARHPIRILGIDPGLRRTGWGLIESDGNRLIHIGCGSFETDERAELGDRLLAIHDGLLAVIEQYRPHEAAVEATFVNTNAAATLKLGQARGIAMLVPAKAGTRHREYRAPAPSFSVAAAFGVDECSASTAASMRPGSCSITADEPVVDRKQRDSPGRAVRQFSNETAPDVDRPGSSELDQAPAGAAEPGSIPECKSEYGPCALFIARLRAPA